MTIDIYLRGSFWDIYSHYLDDGKFVKPKMCYELKKVNWRKPTHTKKNHSMCSCMQKYCWPEIYHLPLLSFTYAWHYKMIDCIFVIAWLFRRLNYEACKTWYITSLIINCSVKIYVTQVSFVIAWLPLYNLNTC